MNRRVRVFLAVATVAAVLTALPAGAEVVFLTSGRTLSVKSHRVEGDAIVLTLRSGGEVTCDKTLIEKIQPDDVPYPEDPVGTSGIDGPAQSSTESNPYADLIASTSEAHGINPMLVHALIQVESGYRPRARSAKGAMGLMQLMPSTAREYNIRNPYDPKANISGGIRHLKSLIDRWGIELALAAYNAGEGAVKKFNGIPPYRETRNYVTRILSLAGIK